MYSEINILQLFFLFLLPNYNTAYELSCPTSSHWTSRAEGLCTIRLAFRYYCLWDTNNKSYTESCSEKPDVAPKGRKYIVEGLPTFVPCSLERYQPIIFYRNTSSHCILLKSLCAEKGQTLSGQGSAENDVRCRCDYKQGYDYVIKPKDICSCNPTQEDCSCYLKQCKNNEYLSSDYQCLLKDSFPVKFQCGQINESREKNNTTFLSKDMLTDSAMRTATNGQTGGIVLIVIIALFIGVRVIYNGISLERQIIGNWRALKETINPDVMLGSLVKEGMIQTDRNNDFKMKSANSQKNHYLICLLQKCSDPSSVNKCIGILRMQGYSTIKVLKRSVINQIWRKRNLEKCRQQLAKYIPSLHEFFNPDQVVDYFFEQFIFNVKDFKDVLNCEDSRTMTQCFMEKVGKSLHKGSFECLLKVLKDNKFDILLEELKTDLVPAIGCYCEDGRIFSQCKVPEDNYEVHMTLSSTNLNDKIEFELRDSSCDCLVCLTEQNQTEDESINVFTANKHFLESHIDVNELLKAFIEQEQYIFQDCDDIPEIDKKAEMFVVLLGRNSNLTYTDNLPDNIIYYFPELVCISDDFDTFRNYFVEGNILCTELDSILEQRHENNRHNMVAFLIEILKSRRRNVMLSLVDSLFMYEHNILAERLLQRREHIIEVSGTEFGKFNCFTSKR
ncbi:unnamed protein product [Mytilus edulis]|uniref:DZIP3-like HEPN domain-containing protein n=1 Tax=Mytilus edulis TaxID=6550 RepID=A0A8S3QKL8_MYTED|nr:unnamed protein product [Mytilus edulis]